MFKRGAATKPLGCLQLADFQSHSPDTLKLLSFNIQVGIETGSYHHYLTKSWQHFLPLSKRKLALMRIAQTMSYFDLVAIQEADGGSFRSGFINQIEFLARKAGFPFWFQQLNRNLGPVAQHSNGVLCRNKPSRVVLHKLPGILPGRGAIFLYFGEGQDALLVVVMHLALSKGAQNRQLRHIRHLIGMQKQVVLMGDMNTHAERLLSLSPLKELDLQPVAEGLETFPSWRPVKGLDHILVSDSVDVKQVGVLDIPVSDHLPIAMEIRLPKAMQQA
ncbi:MAG: endonuclease/exonuclease/phosphatase family metal-dependent hydrolase [Bermanella sp.]|jgi:endonuclease/exonuclease/phosphatase family metal-dependent hydrolase